MECQGSADAVIRGRWDVAQLPSRLEALREHGIELVIIDTPPAFAQTTHAAVNVADLVVVPVRPSPHDLRAVGAVIEAVEQQGKSFVFVINAAIPRTHIALDAVRALGAAWQGRASDTS